MKPKDTVTGGQNRRFPTTMWSEIPRQVDPTSKAFQEMLEGLCHTYWKPVYAYIRTAWKKSVEDAKDLTQAFFTHLMQKDHWSNLKPERGSFRGFLKRAVKNFLIDAERHATVRRPKSNLFSLDTSGEELAQIGPAPGESPESAYDREWFNTLMDSAIHTLRDRLLEQGKAKYYEVFKKYCVDPHTDGPKSTTLLGTNTQGLPTYKQVGEKLGLSEVDVMNYLSHCRKALWAIVRERVREYVGSDEEVELELKEAAGG